MFSSAFRSDDAARDEFAAHLSMRGYRLTDEPRAIAMRIGRTRRAWVNNVVAVGLAGGFIEPLEATAINTIEMTLRHFIHHFPDRQVSPELARRFNRLVETLADNVLEFIVMHYVTSNRDEPFWTAARGDIAVPPGLAENLALWRHVLPGPADTPNKLLFDHWSYLYCFYGKGYWDGAAFPAEGSIRRQEWDQYADHLAATKAALLRELPDHRALVASMRDGTGAARTGTVPLPGIAAEPASGR